VRHVLPGEGQSLWVLGGLVTFLALGEETGGAFTLFEEATAPGSGAFPHVHHGEDQTFYVLEGSTSSCATVGPWRRDLGLSSTSPGAPSTLSRTWERRPAGS
jgi:quercetin dioxygenase-like cupin family protein